MDLPPEGERLEATVREVYGKHYHASLLPLMERLLKDPQRHLRRGGAKIYRNARNPVLEYCLRESRARAYRMKVRVLKACGRRQTAGRPHEGECSRA